MKNKWKRTSRMLTWGLGLWTVIGLAVTGVAADPVAPTLVAPPDGYEAQGPGSGILRLEWEAVEDAWAYEVRISQEGEEFEDYLRFTRRLWLAFGSAREGTFGWEVRAVYVDPEAECPMEGEIVYSVWSEKRSFTVVRNLPGTGPGPQAPPVEFPGNGHALVEGNNYQFRWQNVEGAFQYEVCLETPVGPQYQTVSGNTWEYKTARWAGPRLGPNPEEGAYQFRVRAIGEGGAGEWCDPIQFEYNYGGDHGSCWGPVITTVDPPDLVAPVSGTTLNPTSDGLLGLFSWTEVPGAVYYEISFRDVAPEQGGQMPGPMMRHGIADPPTSVLTEEPSYALVIPEAVEGDRYNWKVRAIVEEGEELRRTEFSETWQFTVGEVVDPPESGDPVSLLLFEEGSSFAGPLANIDLSWEDESNDALYHVAVSDQAMNRVTQNYRKGSGWIADLPDNGGYHLHIRKMDMTQGGQVDTISPEGEPIEIVVSENTTVDGGRRLGDLVQDGEVDSGDAIRALRHSADRENNRLTVRDAAAGDCNGDGQVDSGDAVYMLRKAVGSAR